MFNIFNLFFDAEFHFLFEEEEEEEEERMDFC
jgi:hypothetical protein